MNLTDSRLAERMINAAQSEPHLIQKRTPSRWKI